MSAWVCSDEHINYLVNAASVDDEADAGGADRLGQVLLAENVRSVLHRYGAETIGAKETEEYSAQIAGFRHVRLEPDMVVVLKLLNSWRYQTCETGDYIDTAAWALADRIEANAIRSLPGYDAAPWSL